MTATVFTEAEHPLAFLVSEAPGFQSRDNITVNVNQTIVAGQLLGDIGQPASEPTTVNYNANNVGNGVLTVASVGSGSSDGVYTIVMLTAGATAEFVITTPTGKVGNTGKVGTPFTGFQLNFTISAGSTAWAVGDEISVTVARALGLNLYEAWNPAATDGSQIAVAIAAYPIVTTSATGNIMAITRRAEVRLTDLTFYSGATTAQINEAINNLNSAGITCR